MTEWFEQWFGEEYLPDTEETEVRIRRRFSEEGKYVVKEIELGGENRSFQERVRLFSPTELRGLLEQEGLRVDAVFGDYDGGPLDGRATRTIVVATRP
jgi:hypothetical protein